MKKTCALDFFLTIIMLSGAMSCSYAGSERLIMAMTAERMIQENLVYVRFIGPDGSALESDALKQMVVREKDCNAGQIFEMVKDYKIGYEPKKMLVGIYLYPHTWSDNKLCFSVPKLGKIEQDLNPAGGGSRSINLQLVPY